MRTVRRLVPALIFAASIFAIWLATRCTGDVRDALWWFSGFGMAATVLLEPVRGA